MKKHHSSNGYRYTPFQRFVARILILIMMLSTDLTTSIISHAEDSPSAELRLNGKSIAFSSDYDNVPVFTYGEPMAFELEGGSNLKVYYTTSDIKWDDYHDVIGLTEFNSSTVLAPGDYAIFYESDLGDELGKGIHKVDSEDHKDCTFGVPKYGIRVTNSSFGNADGLQFDGMVAKWSPVSKAYTGSALVGSPAVKYSVSLYKEGSDTAIKTYTDVAGVSYDMSSDIEANGYGYYYFKVKVQSSGYYDASGDVSSKDEESGMYQYMDTVAPSISSFTADKKETGEYIFSGIASDAGTGIKGYAFVKAGTLEESIVWTDVIGDDATPGVSVECEVIPDTEGEYYFYVKDGDGNIAKSSESIKVTKIVLHDYYEAGVMTEKSVYITGKQEYTLPSLSKVGYIFEGWYKNSSFTDSKLTTVTPGNDGITEGGSATLYGKYNKQDIELTVSEKSGKPLSKKYDGASITLVATLPVAATYDSVRYEWYVKKEGATEYTLIPGKTSNEITISQCDDSGSYYAKAILSCAGEEQNTDSSAAPAVVNIERLHITVKPKNLAIDYMDEVPGYLFELVEKEGDDSILSSDSFDAIVNDKLSAMTSDYTRGNEAGTYTITYTGDDPFVSGNYSVGIENSTGVLSVNGMDLSTNENVTITLDKEIFEYTGSSAKPEVTVKRKLSDEVIELTKDTDYTISYHNNIAAGTNTAYVTVSFKGNYRGSRNVYYSITKSSYTRTVSMPGWKFGETASSPSIVEGTKEEATPVFYYKAKTSEAFTRDGGVTDKPVNAGDYYVWAVIPATSNYDEVVTEPTEFTIAKRRIVITADSESWPYDGNSHTKASYKETGDGFYLEDGFLWISVEGEISDMGEVDNEIKYQLTSSTKPENYDIEVNNGKLTVTPYKLVNPSGFDWDSKNSGTVKWIAITRDNFTPSYKLKLYRIDSSGESLVEEVVVDATSHDFLDKIHADSLENGAAGYAVTIQVLSDSDNYSESDESEKTSTKYTAKIGVESGKGIESTTIDGGIVPVIIMQGETKNLSLVRSKGYTACNPSWIVKSHPGLFSITNPGSSEAKISLKTIDVAGPIEDTVVSQAIDENPIVIVNSTTLSDNLRTVYVDFTLIDTLNLDGYAVTKSDIKPADSDFVTISEGDITHLASEEKYSVPNYTITEAGTWYIYVKDKAGNVTCSDPIEIYSISFDPNYEGGSGYGDMLPILKLPNEPVTLPVHSFVKSNGYVFTNWKGETGVYADNGHYVANSDDILHAQWTDRQYTYEIQYYYMTLKKDDTDSPILDDEGKYTYEYIEDTDSTAHIKVSYGTVINYDLKTIQANKKGYTLTDSPEGIDDYKTSITVTEDYHEGDGDVEEASIIRLYYNLNEHSITYTYDYKDGHKTADTKIISYKYNDPVKELPIPVEDGYTFFGWNYGEAGQAPSIMPDNDLNVTGQLQPKVGTYKIYYYKQNLDQTNYTDELAASKSPRLYKKYTFDLDEKLTETINSTHNETITFNIADARNLDGFTVRAVKVTNDGNPAGTWFEDWDSFEAWINGDNNTASGTVDAENNNLCISLYYTRNDYTLKLQVWKDARELNRKLYEESWQVPYGYVFASESLSDNETACSTEYDGTTVIADRKRTYKASNFETYMKKEWLNNWESVAEGAPVTDYELATFIDWSTGERPSSMPAGHATVTREYVSSTVEKYTINVWFETLSSKTDAQGKTIYYPAGTFVQKTTLEKYDRVGSKVKVVETEPAAEDKQAGTIYIPLSELTKGVNYANRYEHNPANDLTTGTDKAENIEGIITKEANGALVLNVHFVRKEYTSYVRYYQKTADETGEDITNLIGYTAHKGKWGTTYYVNPLYYFTGASAKPSNESVLKSDGTTFMPEVIEHHNSIVDDKTQYIAFAQDYKNGKYILSYSGYRFLPTNAAGTGDYSSSWPSKQYVDINNKMTTDDKHQDDDIDKAHLVTLEIGAPNDTSSNPSGDDKDIDVTKYSPYSYINVYYSEQKKDMHYYVTPTYEEKDKGSDFYKDLTVKLSDADVDNGSATLKYNCISTNTILSDSDRDEGYNIVAGDRTEQEGYKVYTVRFVNKADIFESSLGTGGDFADYPGLATYYGQYTYTEEGGVEKLKEGFKKIEISATYDCQVESSEKDEYRKKHTVSGTDTYYIKGDYIYVINESNPFYYGNQAYFYYFGADINKARLGYDMFICKNNQPDTKTLRVEKRHNSSNILKNIGTENPIESNTGVSSLALYYDTYNDMYVTYRYDGVDKNSGPYEYNQYISEMGHPDFSVQDGYMIVWYKDSNYTDPAVPFNITKHTYLYGHREKKPIENLDYVYYQLPKKINVGGVEYSYITKEEMNKASFGWVDRTTYSDENITGGAITGEGNEYLKTVVTVSYINEAKKPVNIKGTKTDYYIDGLLVATIESHFELSFTEYTMDYSQYSKPGFIFNEKNTANKLKAFCITTPIDLYAYYERNICTLTIARNNVKNANDEVVDYNSGSLITISDPVKAGYVFGGWKLEEATKSGEDIVKRELTDEEKAAIKYKNEGGSATFQMPPYDTIATAIWIPTEVDNKIYYYFQNKKKIYNPDLVADLETSYLIEKDSVQESGKYHIKLYNVNYGGETTPFKAYFDGNKLIAVSREADDTTYYYSDMGYGPDSMYHVDESNLLAAIRKITITSEATCYVDTYKLPDAIIGSMFEYAYTVYQQDTINRVLPYEEEDGTEVNSFPAYVDMNVSYYYQRDAHKEVTVIKKALDNGDSGLTITGEGYHYYGEDITLYASMHAGYEFKGWYKKSDVMSDGNLNIEGKTPLCTDLTYTFSVTDSTELVAVTKSNDVTMPTSVIASNRDVSANPYVYGYEASGLNSLTDKVTWPEGGADASYIVGYKWYRVFYAPDSVPDCVNNGTTAENINNSDMTELGNNAATILFPTGEKAGKYVYRCEVTIGRKDNERTKIISSDYVLTVNKAEDYLEIVNTECDYDTQEHTFACSVTDKIDSDKYTIYYSEEELTDENISAKIDSGLAVTEKPSYVNVKVDDTAVHTVIPYEVYVYVKSKDPNCESVKGKGTVKINPIFISVNAKKAFVKTYDGTEKVQGSFAQPSSDFFMLATGDYYTIDGLLPSEKSLQVALDFDAAYNSKHVSDAVSLELSNMWLSEKKVDDYVHNYNYRFPNGTTLHLSGQIKPYRLGITWDSIVEFNYDGTEKKPSVLIKDGGPDGITIDKVRVTNGQINSGTYKAGAEVIKVSESDNYEPSDYTFTITQCQYTIKPRLLRVTPVDTTLVYNGSMQTSKGVRFETKETESDSWTEYSSLPTGETCVVTINEGGKDVGTYTVSLADDIKILDGSSKNIRDNYVITKQTGTLNIVPCPVIITGITANDKDYDGNTSATLVLTDITYSVLKTDEDCDIVMSGDVPVIAKSGLYAGDALDVESTKVIGNFVNSKAGVYKTVNITYDETGRNPNETGGILKDKDGKTSASNYYFVAEYSQKTTTANIGNNTVLSASIEDVNSTYGEVPDYGNITYTGFKGTDNASNITITKTSEGVDKLTYVIKTIPESGESATIEVADGLSDAIKKLPAGRYHIYLKTDDNGVVQGLSCEDYTIKWDGQPKTLTVAKRPISVKAKDGAIITKAYDATTDVKDDDSTIRTKYEFSTTSDTESGVANEDAIYLKSYSGAYNDKDVEDANKVTFTDLVLDDESANNYVLKTSSFTIKGAITKIPLAITVSDLETTYGSPAPAYKYTITGAVESEEEEVKAAVIASTKPDCEYSATASSPNRKAGEYAITVDQEDSSKCYVNGNYTISYTGAKLVVKKAKVYFNPENVTITYSKDDIPTSYTGSFDPSGWKYGESFGASDDSKKVVIRKPNTTTISTITELGEYVEYNINNGIAIEKSKTPAGDYDIEATNITVLTSDNYEFLVKKGTLKIAKYYVSVHGVWIAGKIYDGTKKVAPGNIMKDEIKYTFYEGGSKVELTVDASGNITLTNEEVINVEDNLVINAEYQDANAGSGKPINVYITLKENSYLDQRYVLLVDNNFEEAKTNTGVTLVSDDITQKLADAFILTTDGKKSVKTDILKRPLTLYPLDKTIKYGENIAVVTTVPEGAGNYSLIKDVRPTSVDDQVGFVEGESFDVIGFNLSYKITGPGESTDNYSVGSDVGRYKIIINESTVATSSNYDVAYTTGTLTVEKNKLKTPAPVWDDDKPGTVKWEKSPNIGNVKVDHYKLVLYKDGVETEKTYDIPYVEETGTYTEDLSDDIRELENGAYTVKVTAIASTTNNDGYKNVDSSDEGVTEASIYAAKVVVSFATDAVTASAITSAESYKKIGEGESVTDSYVVIAGESNIPVKYFWKNSAGYSSGYTVEKCESSKEELTFSFNGDDKSKNGKYEGTVAMASSLSSADDIALTLSLKQRSADINVVVKESNNRSSIMYSYPESEAPIYSTTITHEDDTEYTYTYKWKYVKGSTTYTDDTDMYKGETFKLYTEPHLSQYTRYLVYCTVTATRKDNGASASKAARTDLIVERAKPGENSVKILLNGAEVSGTGWMYGDARGVFTTSPQLTGLGTITLYYSNSNTDSASWSTTVPTDVGTYYVKFSIAQSENYEAYDLPSEKAKSFVITKNTLATPTNLHMKATSTLPYGKATWNVVAGPKENAGGTGYKSEVSVTYKTELYYSKDDAASYTKIKEYDNSKVVINGDEASVDMTADMKADGFYYYTVKAYATCKYTDGTNAPVNCLDSEIATSEKQRVLAKLDVTGADSVTAMKAEKVYNGEDIILTVGGSGDYTYEWYKDGAPVSGATSNSIHLTYVEDTGIYVCHITAIGGEVFYSSYENVIIQPRPLTITSYSLTREYNGNALTYSDATMSAAGKGSSSETYTPDAMDNTSKKGIVINKSGDKTFAEDKITAITQTGSITTAGSVKNSLSNVVITRTTYNEDGSVKGTKIVYSEGASNNNYTVTYNCGTLKITKGSLTVTAKTDSKTYDGTALVNAGFDTDGIPVTSSDVVTAEITGTITNAGNTDNVVGNVTVKNGSGVDVTSSYNITKVNGKLTVNKKLIGDGDSTEADITVSEVAAVNYDKTAYTPVITVTDAGRKDASGSTLIKDKDYTVGYTDNTNAGTATITVTGIGNYSGSFKKTFTINEATLTSVEILNAEYEYNASSSKTAAGETKKVIASIGAGTLDEVPVAGYDVKLYRVEGASEVEVPSALRVGTYRVKATGKGNYTGTVVAEFKIKDTDMPSITGVDNSGIYCETKNIAISDKTLVSVVITKDGSPFISEDYAANDPYKTSYSVSLSGDEDGTDYVITATDASGNAKTISCKIYEDHLFTSYTLNATGGTKTAHCDHGCGATDSIISRWGNVAWDYNYSYTNSTGGIDSGIQGVDARVTFAKVELLQNGVVIATRIVDCEDTCGPSAVSPVDADNKSFAFNKYKPGNPAALPSECDTYIPVTDASGEEYEYLIHITPINGNNTAAVDYMVNVITEDAVQNYSLYGDGHKVKITYSPGQFMVPWHVTLKDVPVECAPDAIYVKVLFAYSENADDTETNTGYQIITQHAANTGVKCYRHDKHDGTFFYEGQYPVWDYQGNSRDSYYHRIQVTGYEYNGVYTDVTDKKYKSINDSDHVNHTIYYTGTEASGIIKYEIKGMSLKAPLVIFDYNAGGNPVSGDDVKNILLENLGDSVSAEVIGSIKPSRSGYTFGGWYTEPNGGERVTSIASLTETMVLYARWNKIENKPAGGGNDKDPEPELPVIIPPKKPAEDIDDVPDEPVTPEVGPVTPSKPPVKKNPGNKPDEKPDTPEVNPGNGPGNVTVTTAVADDPNKNDNQEKKIIANIPDTEDVIDTILSEEEKERVRNGEDIHIRLTVDDTRDNEPDENLIKFMDDLTKEYAKDLEEGKPGYKSRFVSHIDFKLDKKVADEEWQKVINSGKPIKVEITIPKDKLKEGERVVLVKKVGDSYIIIEDLDDNPDTITIETSDFDSEYALIAIYDDEVALSAGGIPQGDKDISASKKSEVCYWHYVIYVTDVIYVVMILATVKRKKDEEEEDEELDNKANAKGRKKLKDKSKNRRVIAQTGLAVVFIAVNIVGFCYIDLPASIVSYVVISVAQVAAYKHKFKEDNQE